MKKLIASIVAVIMLFSVVGGTLAEGLPGRPEKAAPEHREIDSGTCGDDLTWTFDTETGLLTISGTGDMYDYSAFQSINGEGLAPWIISNQGQYTSQVTSVSILPGVTSIGDNAFIWCEALTTIVIPDSVERISEEAFSFCSSLADIDLSPDNQFFRFPKECCLTSIKQRLSSARRQRQEAIPFRKAFRS